ncbi:hypothetical protein PHET_03884 [Paragonimus heterotremus]|uniref:5-formyltetrahydrofolate cyclo-ligase n=1 Tax=Paragonimus heterotremus TaxID=100268 RepID=A0A8J4SZD6_9TREM|nr:hypothetical protein PHET_03884 [Paragonimus heterotremus]
MELEDRERFHTQYSLFLEQLSARGRHTPLECEYNRMFFQFTRKGISALFEGPPCCRPVCVNCFHFSPSEDKHLCLYGRKRYRRKAKRSTAIQVVWCRRCGSKQTVMDFVPSVIESVQISDQRVVLKQVEPSIKKSFKKKKKRLVAYKLESPICLDSCAKKSRKSALQGLFSNFLSLKIRNSFQLMANSKTLIRQHMKTLLRSISPTQLAIKSERLAEQKGRLPIKLTAKAINMLDSLTKAPLKPYQRLEILKAILIPKLKFELVVGNAHRNTLRKLDRLVRDKIRTWLRLPKDTTLAFMHSKTDGHGLGIPCLETTIPLEQRTKCERLVNSGTLKVANIVQCKAVVLDITVANVPILVYGKPVNSKSEEDKAWRKALVKTHDCADLMDVQLFSSCEYQKCRSIAVYLSLPNEPDTLPVVRDSLSTGRKVFVPQVLSEDLRFVNNLQGNNSGMTMQRLHSLEQLSQWPLNKWNIRSPPLPTKWDQVVDQAVEDGGVDLVIVPGLAFTRNGKRLGRGGGYYDRYLNWCRARSSTSELNWPMLVALAFEEQLMEELPTQPHDVQVDRVFFA